MPEPAGPNESQASGTAPRTPVTTVGSGPASPGDDGPSPGTAAPPALIPAQQPGTSPPGEAAPRNAGPPAAEAAASTPPATTAAGAVWGTAMWRVAGAVMTQSALISAVLYYFGAVRLRATFDYFGVDAGGLGFTVADYLVHSVNAAFQPLVAAGLVALPALAAHRRLVVPVLAGTATPRHTHRVRRAATLCRGFGLAGCALVLAAMVDRRDVGQPLGIALPLILAGAVALIAYGHRLSAPTAALAADAVVPARLRSLTLAVLAAVGLLWATGMYAQRIGHDYARYLAANLHERPRVVLYSTEPLAIAGAGVRTQRLGGPGRYTVRYWNLRLLAQRNDLLLLLPASWQPGTGPVYVVPRDPGVRLDLTAPP